MGGIVDSFVTLASAALRNIKKSPQATLRVVFVPWLLSLLVAYVSNTFFTLDPPDIAAVTSPQIWPLLVNIGLFGLYVGINIWLIVAWHRYIVEGEVPKGLAPEWSTRRSGYYFLQALRVALITMLLAYVFFVLVGFSMRAFGVGLLSNLNSALSFMFAVFYFFSFRFGLILPAATLDEKLSLRDSWMRTKSATLSIAIVSIVLCLWDLGVRLLSDFAASDLVAAVIGVVGYSVLALYALSFLTVLYQRFKSPDHTHS